MQIRAALLAALVALVALFAAMNWPAFTAPTALWLGFATVQAPLGVVMLGIVAFVVLLFVAWVIWLQGRVLVETRRHTRELAAQRELADKAEASRFTELRRFVSEEFDKLARAEDASRAATLERFDELEQRHRTALEHSINGLAASIGELEDRLERQLALPGRIGQPERR